MELYKVILLQVVYLSVVVCVFHNGYEHLQWSTACSTDYVYTSFFDVSLPQCYEECARRKTCTFFQYRSRFHMCELCGTENTSQIFNHRSRRFSPCLHGVPSDSDFDKQFLAYSGLAKCRNNPCSTIEVCLSSPALDNVTCLSRECKAPTETPNVRTSGNTNKFESQMMFSCTNGSSGLNHVNTQRLTCTGNGTWSNRDFQCHPDCPSPPDIANAHAPPNGNNASVYNNVTYTCIAGFSSVSPLTVTCLPDETTTQSYWTFPTSACLPDCTNPSVESASLVDYTAGTSFPTGSEQHYSCLPGFSPTSIQSLTCNASGYWEPSSPCTLSSCSGSLTSLYEFDETYSRCYKFYESILTVAAEICDIFEGTLLVVSNMRDKDFVKHIMNVKNINTIYIGPIASYTDSLLATWAPQEPDGTGDCVQITRMGAVHAWSDIACDVTLSYIIMKDL